MVTSEQDRGLECDLDSEAASADRQRRKGHTEKKKKKDSLRFF